MKGIEHSIGVNCWLRFSFAFWRKLVLALYFLLLVAHTGLCDSSVWSIHEFFSLDSWNSAILPFTATIPAGMRVRPENLRAMVQSSELAQLRSAAAKQESKRLVKRATVNELKTDDDVKKTRGYLLPLVSAANSKTVDAFQVGAGYVDKFGLLGILQVVAKWQCAANEKCPDKIAAQLENLLAKGGAIMKTETFFEINGKPWVLATITYEVPVGQERRVVPLQSRLLEVQMGK